MKGSGKRKFRAEFKEDYNKQVVRLFFFVYPLMEKGWTEDQVYSLLLFMEKNKELVRNKKLDQIIALYSKHSSTREKA